MKTQNVVLIHSGQPRFSFSSNYISITVDCGSAPCLVHSGSNNEVTDPIGDIAGLKRARREVVELHIILKTPSRKWPFPLTIY